MNYKTALIGVSAILYIISMPHVSAKTIKECVDEWRADKAGMQSRGIKQNDYIKKCKTDAGDKPTPASAAEQTRPPRGATAPEPGRFAIEAQAKTSCPTDTVVWVNLTSRIYHFNGADDFGKTKRGTYMCEKNAKSAEFRAAKNAQRPK